MSLYITFSNIASAPNVMLETETAHRLNRYLDAPITRLRILASGWETTVFEFELESCSARFPELPPQRPLVLRFYQGILADDKGSRESRVIERLYSVHYLVPRPYVYEPAHEALGAPFLIMEKIWGGPLFSATSFAHAVKTFSLGFFGFVRAQVKLHRINPRLHEVRDIPRSLQASATPPGTSLLDRALAVIAERVEKGPLPGLKDALRRLAGRAGVYRVADPSIVHMDYHPLNVMVDGVHVKGVIDWVNTDVGDRHLDAAMTAAILSSSAFEHPRWMRDNLIGNSLRSTFASTYVPLYHAMARLDFERFRYCQAVAALLRLSMLGMMKMQGPETVGFRSEAIGEVTPAVVRLLTRYAERKTGASVRLDLAPVPA
jgi:aminoglycoside phosphotransferase (APT) family kinase protein